MSVLDNRFFLTGISDLSCFFGQKHTPATLSIQAQITVASFGWHCGSIRVHSLPNTVHYRDQICSTEQDESST